MTKKRSESNTGTENGFPIILWRWFVIVIWHLGKRAENGNADGKEIEWVFLGRYSPRNVRVAKFRWFAWFFYIAPAHDWRTFLRNHYPLHRLAYVRAHSRKFCTNERRCGIPSFVGIMSYYWLELTTRADGITTVVTFWHARYLHTQHHKNSTPPNAYSISYITSAQHSKLGYFWLCVALSLSEALLFFKSFASYFNHYICSFKCENKCSAALKNDGQDKSAWKKIAFFAWEKPFFIMKLRTYLKHVVRHIRQCFKIMEEMVECQKWITFNNRKVEFK